MTHPLLAAQGEMLRSAAANMLSRVGRAPAFRPRARAMSGMPGKEQMNAAAARAGDEAANLGASIGENVQKLQWWTSAKVRRHCPKHCVSRVEVWFVHGVGMGWPAVSGSEGLQRCLETLGASSTG